MSTATQLLGTLLEDRGRGRPLNTGVCRYLEEHHGVRFCKRCASLLPVASFPKGQRVYTCLAHRGEQRTAKKRATRARAIKNMHAMACRDRGAFGQATMLLTPGEMDLLLAQRGAAEAEEVGRWCLVPWDPTSPLSSANCRLLPKPRRRALLSRWAASGSDPYAYSAALFRMLS
jgi:hypothetical protein